MTIKIPLTKLISAVIMKGKQNQKAFARSKTTQGVLSRLFQRFNAKVISYKTFSCVVKTKLTVTVINKINDIFLKLS